MKSPEDKYDVWENNRERRYSSADKTYESIRVLDKVSATELEAALSGDFGPDTNERYGEIIITHDLWTAALGMAFHKDPRVAFRVSWALEWAYFHDRESFKPYADIFLRSFMDAKNPSVHRHYTKMLHDMMRKGIIVLSDDEAEAVAEKSFDLLIDPKTKAAVRVWASEILFDLSPRLPWISDHLEEVVRRQIEMNPTPGIINHGNKLLKRISRINNK